MDLGGEEDQHTKGGQKKRQGKRYNIKYIPREMNLDHAQKGSLSVEITSDNFQAARTDTSTNCSAA